MQWLDQLVVEQKLCGLLTQLIVEQDHGYWMVNDYLRLHFPEESKRFDRKTVADFFKAKGVYTTSKSNKTSNMFRYQYRYSPEEILQNCKRGATAARQKRKTNGRSYNPKQTIEFWNQQIEDIGAAQAALTAYKRSNSPKCVEFWLNRGLSEVDAIKHITQKASLGAIAALKCTQKPKTEKIVAAILIEEKIKYSIQYKIMALQQTTKRKALVFDFYLPDFNLLIEVNGTYWHCDPRIWNSTDVMNFPGGNVVAEEIWKRDAQKQNEAISQGYRTITVWELETKNKEDLKKWLLTSLSELQT